MPAIVTVGQGCGNPAPAQWRLHTQCSTTLLSHRATATQQCDCPPRNNRIASKVRSPVPPTRPAAGQHVAELLTAV